MMYMYYNTRLIFEVEYSSHKGFYSKYLYFSNLEFDTFHKSSCNGILLKRQKGQKRTMHILNIYVKTSVIGAREYNI